VTKDVRCERVVHTASSLYFRVVCLTACNILMLQCLDSGACA
jgi:hypothetical protein